jgi:hypothetical protein
MRHTEAVQLLSDIGEAKRLFIETQSDAAQEPGFKKAAQRILTAIRLDSPFSGEMRFVLGGKGTKLILGYKACLKPDERRRRSFVINYT